MASLELKKGYMHAKDVKGNMVNTYSRIAKQSWDLPHSRVADSENKSPPGVEAETGSHFRSTLFRSYMFSTDKQYDIYKA